ncbi:hypothetical protein SAMD00019534_052760, partial [Acytostelium subglobosum LB1]|uniref:hypothetical protein n=1 Tax=Acytostelium subglobosum LB1 TaxID=1410327 RepID=UPI000644D090
MSTRQRIIPLVNGDSPRTRTTTESKTTTTTTSPTNVSHQQHQQNNNRHRRNEHDQSTIKKTMKYLSPLIVGLILYTLYGNMFQPMPAPPMHTSPHIGPQIWSRIQNLWQSYIDRSTIAQYQEPEINLYTPDSYYESAVKSSPNVHHPHSVDDHFARIYASGPKEVDMAYKTHGINPWDTEKPKKDSIYDKIDQYRDWIISKLYGYSLDHSEALTKELQEKRQRFENEKAAAMADWNVKFDADQVDQMNRMRYKARESNREAIDLEYRRQHN